MVPRKRIGELVERLLASVRRWLIRRLVRMDFEGEVWCIWGLRSR